MYVCVYLQFNKALEVKFDETGTHVVDVPVDKCRCPPPPPPQDCCVFRKVGYLVTKRKVKMVMAGEMIEVNVAIKILSGKMNG